MTTAQRRHILHELLRPGAAASQQELADALAQRGFEVTQATVSRDLAAIGALKSRAGYTLPDAVPSLSAAPGADSQVASVLRRHATQIRQADALIVINTVAGHASVVADAIDKTPPKHVVGTIAGDDTVFVAATSRTSAAKVTRQLSSTMKGSSAS